MKDNVVSGPIALNFLEDPDNFNCGGFALGCLDWYVPEGYRNGESIDDCLEDGANIIQKDFPNLTRITHYSKVPEHYDVIGFRFDVRQQEICKMNEDGQWEDTGEFEDEIDDFHFIVRINGRWFHKPGARDIEEADFGPDDEWPHSAWGNYNSRIIWFFRQHNKLYDIENYTIH